MIRILVVSVLLLAVAAPLAFSESAIEFAAGGDSATGFGSSDPPTIFASSPAGGIPGRLLVGFTATDPCIDRTPAISASSAFDTPAIISGSETSSPGALLVSETDAVPLFILQKQEDPFPIGMMDSFFIEQIVIEVLASVTASALR